MQLTSVEPTDKNKLWAFEKIVLDQQSTIEKMKSDLLELNNALNVLRVNNYDATSRGYAEFIHKQYQLLAPLSAATIVVRKKLVRYYPKQIQQ